MINVTDQEELFKLIADYLENDIQCTAIGGTAMMFLGYKTATKDIDLVFASKVQRDIFIEAIKELGYSQTALSGIYDERKKKHSGKPVMYSRGDERFDLFVKDVFGYVVETTRIVERRDFIGKRELTLLVLPKEELVLLKAVTGRERDFEDIQDILRIEKNLDWNMIVDMAIRQKKVNEWILIDLEECLQRLKKITFIPEKHFKKIYQAQRY